MKLRYFLSLSMLQLQLSSIVFHQRWTTLSPPDVLGYNIASTVTDERLWELSRYLRGNSLPRFALQEAKNIL